MVVLEWLDRSGSKATRRKAAVFGLGLIGSAIHSHLISHRKVISARHSFTWQPGPSQTRQLDAIFQLLATPHGEVDLIWAAGSAGFGAAAEQFLAEHRVFSEVLNKSRELCTLVNRVRFHLLSSGGGLFEGQTHVSAHSRPRPLRPYGEAKWRLEQQAVAELGQGVCIIYRPSSVYGYAGPDARSGLVSTALNCAFANRTLRIFARPDTIRDYVLTEDIGRFVAQQVFAGVEQSQTYILASGKPTSTFEMMVTLEELIGRKLFVRYESQVENALPISFARSALPVDWRVTDLRAGLAITAARFKSMAVEPGYLR